MLVENLKAAGRRVDQPLVVAVGGVAGVGKSSVLNAVFTSGLLPEGPLPSPGCRVVSGTARTGGVEVRYAGGVRQPIDVEWWYAAVAQGDFSALTGAERLEIAVPYELLESMALIDTPGLYSEDERDSRATEDTLSAAEALLWVTAADDPLPALEVQALQRFARQLAGRAVCVLTRSDALEDPMTDIPAAREHVAEILPGYFSAVAAIDVRAGEPEAATPVLSAIKKGILARRETSSRCTPPVRLR